MTSQIAWADDENLKEAFPLTFKVKDPDQILVSASFSSIKLRSFADSIPVDRVTKTGLCWTGKLKRDVHLLRKLKLLNKMKACMASVTLHYRMIK